MGDADAQAGCLQVDQPEGEGASGLSTLADAAAAQAAAPPAQAQAQAPLAEGDMMEGMDEELRAALQMSLQVPCAAAY